MTQPLTATSIAEREHRLRMIAMSAVAQAHEHVPEIDPERCERDAHDLALYAAYIAIERIMNGDTELTAMRIERDHYKALAETALVMTPITASFAALHNADRGA
jgi:hypothetical protein